MFKLMVWFVLIDVPLALLRVLVAITGPVFVTLALPFPECVTVLNDCQFGPPGGAILLTEPLEIPLTRRRKLITRFS